MSTLRALKKLILGETWILPLGIAATLAAMALIESLAGDDWPHVGGPLLLAAVVAVLLASVARSARRR
jgi:hypothetical protein